MLNAEPRQQQKSSLKTFLLLFLLISALLVGMCAAFYYQQKKNYLAQLSADEHHSINLQRAVARNHFRTIISDLNFLSAQQSLQAYLEDSSAPRLAALNRDFLAFATSKKNYDQLRYLDETGMEVARVNFHPGFPRIVPAERLQNKSTRYYFTETYQLQQGEVYVSPFDLNIEHGQIEKPHKPMIRFGTPVFDAAGRKRGIMLVNYLGQNLLNLLLDVGAAAHGQMMLVNASGFWLLHPDPSREWGFMFPERSFQTLASQNPELWTRIRDKDSGQMQMAEGLFTFTTLRPLSRHAGEIAGADDYFWKIVNFISRPQLTAHSRALFQNLLLLAAGLLLLGAGIAWFLTAAFARHKLYQAQLYQLAHFDKLTGLPNRTLFYDRFRQALELAKRNARQCALLYVDLDGFKQVNDQFGHAAGDQLLAAVAKRLARCCRSSDTVARLGGDEFAILLTEVTNVNGVESCSEKLLAELEEPFHLSSGQAQIGASIGISLFPSHGATTDELLRQADQAMYLSKNRGKNTFTSAEELST